MILTFIDIYLYICIYIHTYIIHMYTYIDIYTCIHAKIHTSNLVDLCIYKVDLRRSNLYIHTYIPTCIPSWISGPRLRAMPRQIYAKECAAQVSHACVINPAPHPCGRQQVSNWLSMMIKVDLCRST